MYEYVQKCSFSYIQLLKRGELCMCMCVKERKRGKSGVHVSKTNSFCSSSQFSPHFSHTHVINNNLNPQLTIYLSDDDDDDDDYHEGSLCSLCAHCEVGSSELY